MQTLNLTAAVEIQAAADKSAAPRVSIVAYTGDLMNVRGFGPAVIDLRGLEVGDSTTLLADHDATLAGVVGSGRPRVEGGQLLVEGTLSLKASEAARKILDLHRDGVRFQASVGVEPSRASRATEAAVNGRAIKSATPFTLVSSGRLREVTITALGADGNTSVAIAAARKQRTAMPETLNDQQPQDHQQPQPPADPERQRVAAIVKLQARYNERPEAIATIAAQAIENGWDANKAELEMLRANRPAPAFIASGYGLNRGGGAAGGPDQGRVIEASLCMAGGLRPDWLEAHGFDERTLDAASGRGFRDFGLQRLLRATIAAAGRSDASLGAADLVRSAFEADRMLQASGYSTVSLPGILGNTANKFLLEGFEAVENAWRMIASRRPVSDFKAATSYRLTGDFEFVEVPPQGEIRHANAGEESYSNAAKMYARMFVLSYQDLRNDDLGAFVAIPRRIGRGGALKFNKVFWTAFLDNAAFFATGNNNYLSGVTVGTNDSRLNIEGLTRATTSFRRQTDPDGHPLALQPSVVLVPPELEASALALMKSITVTATGGGATAEYAPSGNVFAGVYPTVVSAYLSNASYTGYSATAWYLLGNPASLATIEAAFLDGRETPTVESADTDFSTLGMQFRGSWAFGVTKQEHRAGVKSKGAA